MSDQVDPRDDEIEILRKMVSRAEARCERLQEHLEAARASLDEMDQEFRRRSALLVAYPNDVIVFESLVEARATFRVEHDRLWDAETKLIAAFNRATFHAGKCINSAHKVIAASESLAAALDQETANGSKP